MNPIALILIALLVVLMVAFSHHRPSGKAMDQTIAADSTDSSDPLVQAIEEHNKLQQQGYFPISPTGSNPNASDNGNNGFPTYLLNNQYLQRNAPHHTQNLMNPYEAANPYHPSVMPAPASPASPSGQDSYYPPPVGAPLPPHSDTKLDSDIQRVLPYINLPGQSQLYLASGQRITFVGSAAYALNEKGWPTPLPDGKYAMYDGRLTITIRGGHKVIN